MGFDSTEKNLKQGAQEIANLLDSRHGEAAEKRLRLDSKILSDRAMDKLVDEVNQLEKKKVGDDLHVYTGNDGFKHASLMRKDLFLHLFPLALKDEYADTEDILRNQINWWDGKENNWKDASLDNEPLDKAIGRAFNESDEIDQAHRTQIELKDTE